MVKILDFYCVRYFWQKGTVYVFFDLHLFGFSPEIGFL